MTGLFLGAWACGDGEGEADTTAYGQASYRDAATDAEGNPRRADTPPAQPSSNPMQVEIFVSGTGEMSGLEPRCALDAAGGSFSGLLFGEAQLSGDGAYVAGLASAQADFQSLSGCDIPELQITAVSEVVVRGTLSATTQNCTTYCAARARSHGEAECGAGAGQTACRAEAEAEYQASCDVACSAGTTHVIAAETRLSAQAVAELSARSLTGAALGELEVDLVFDRLESGDGSVVSEAP